MTIAERLADAHQRSVALYLRMTELEQQRQELVMHVSVCQQGLVRLDGEISLLMKLRAEEAA